MTTKPAPAPYMPDTPLFYLMTTSDAERKRWGARAVELGFPERRLYTDASFDALMPWRKIVAEEMRQEGLWAPAAVKVVPVPVEVTTLPVCPSTVRAVPNDILRSALFAAIQGKTRRHLDKELIASFEGVEIRFKGDQLDQADRDVWDQAIHTAKDQPFGNICHFKAYDFLKSIGRGTGRDEYEWLHESIGRLIACYVEIKRGKRVFTGSLLHTCVRDEETNEYMLSLDAKTLNLYSHSDWTGIECSYRRDLMRKPLALWLSDYFASHAKPFPIKVETLRKLCGSENKNLKSFRPRLKAALDELKTCGALSEWAIDPKTDLVTVDRGAAITASQSRHVIKLQNPNKILRNTT